MKHLRLVVGSGSPKDSENAEYLKMQESLNNMTATAKLQELIKYFHKARELLGPANVYRNLLAAEILDNVPESSLKSETGQQYLIFLQNCYPKNFTKNLLSESIRVCHILVTCQGFDSALKILQTISGVSERFFLQKPPPFWRRLAYLKDCISDRKPALTLEMWMTKWKD